MVITRSKRHFWFFLLLFFFLLEGCVCGKNEPISNHVADVKRTAYPFVLVSDVDDTVKITNVLDHDEAIENALSKKMVFVGMPELYKYILGENSPAERLSFLSGSPKLLNDKVKETLTQAKFPLYKLTLRNTNESFINSFKYKQKRMKEMYSASEDKFLLVGDDTECDPEVYEDFSSLKKNKVLAIYIHRITGRQLPCGSIAFLTAYDIAMHEFLAGRLNETQAKDVANVVLNTNDINTFLPNFQQCPENYEEIAGLPDTLVQLKKQIEGKMTALCSNRMNTKCK